MAWCSIGYADDVALEDERPPLMQHGHHLRDLRRVEVLVLVRGHCRVEVRNKRGNRQLVRPRVRDPEQMPYRARGEVEPIHTGTMSVPPSPGKPPAIRR